MAETATNPEIAAMREMAKPGKLDRRGGASSRQAQPQGGGAVYGLGMIGALAYFVASADGGRGYAMAFGKAMVWPALLVYRAFRFLHR